MVKTQNFIFNSSYRHSGFDSNPTFIIPNVGITAKRVYVNSVSIPHTFYNITDYNHKFLWEDSIGASFVSDIPKGNYTISELLTTLGNVMTTDATDGLTYTATRDTITNKVTITNSGPAVFSIFNDPLLDKENVPFIFTLLGFAYWGSVFNNIPLIDSDLTGSSSYTGASNYYISTRNIYIKSNICKKSQSYKSNSYVYKYDPTTTGYKTSSGVNDILLYIPVTTSYGDRITWYAGNNPMKLELSNHLTDISFQLISDDNNQDLWLNGVPWTIELTFEC